MKFLKLLLQFLRRDLPSWKLGQSFLKDVYKITHVFLALALRSCDTFSLSGTLRDEERDRWDMQKIGQVVQRPVTLTPMQLLLHVTIILLCRDYAVSTYTQRNIPFQERARTGEI